MILKNNVDTFLFGSKSRFNDLCCEIVCELKEKYPHIRRIFVRAEFPEIDEKYLVYLLQMYDDTYYPQRIIGAGKAVYIERNCEMIDKCNYCVMYYDDTYTSVKRKSGTKLAYDYAAKKSIQIINVLKPF